MLRLKPLHRAVLTATAATFASSQAMAAVIEEIIVTAQKRSASAQDVPVAVQAFDEKTLGDLNIGNFDDYARYLPNLTFGGRGPGQSTTYIRGMAVQPITVLLSGAQGTAPNVALYQDEQPVTAPGRNLDVYATDLQRIEVLAGPQGTLFGASSQAGTIRLITNKPRFEAFTAGINTTLSSTKDGDMSTGVEGFLNIPVNDSVALRAAFYSIQEGGYIDNVQGSFTTDPALNPASTATPNAVFYAAGNNTALVEEDFNDSYYRGARLSARWLLNADWDLLVQHTQQELGADGVFDYDPTVGDLEVQRYFKDELEDEFGLSTWTVTGRLGQLDLVYTGGYLDREIDQSVDYTGYNNSGAFISYYTCTYDNPAYIVNYGIDPRFVTPGGRECLDPSKGAVIHQEQTRITHELRFSTPEDRRVRVTAGVFYDDFEIETQDDYIYTAAPDLGFAPNAPISTAKSINNGTRAPGVTFFNDITRSEKQMAVFGEVSFDILPQTLEMIVGARYYDLEIDFFGSSNFADGIFQGSQNTDRGRDYDVNGGHSTDPLELDDVITKFTLNWTPRDNMLLYATWSEGYRPGGFNRGGGIPSVNPNFPTVNTTYDTDDVVNMELGWKTRWLDGQLQVNGNIYRIEWTDMQVSRFDPQNVSILTFIENAADSEITGLEGDVVYAASDQLTLFGAFSINDTELTDVFGQAVELAPVGSELPLVPDFQATARARYNFTLGEFQGFSQVAVQYAEESFSSLVAVDRFEQDSYTTADLSMGLGKGNWGAELFVENLTDERADLHINNQDDIRRVTTNRPRTVSLRVRVDF